ncbi:hypothetical protein L6164_002116 [Bauhinia variegata]|uniref:Uncharacterized protein n=1 Tax=Bauhinia variegata TaxID=167791 RepID=A0ACB9PZY1_BAUVA|nr:hypothetical protein L6164_002116 [Bauhinia variegata]
MLGLQYGCSYQEIVHPIALQSSCTIPCIWWQHAANLASYEQQDAHEFFVSMLDGIHEKVEKDRRNPHSQGNGECCIAHRVFSGILRSDVMCMACGFTSTTYDPCIYISL